jgi:hypothetical protein
MDGMTFGTQGVEHDRHVDSGAVDDQVRHERMD